VTIALPTVIGHKGAGQALEPSMSDDEHRAFERSVETLKDAARNIGVG
jgi:malate/lactate dehydrogenase